MLKEKEFFEWLISMGCPAHLIPGENKMNEIVRAKILPVENIMKYFRPAEEAKRIQDRNLRVELCKIKSGNFMIADKRTVPEEYLQYAKLNAIKKDIHWLESNIEDLNSDLNCRSHQLAEKNGFKRQKKEFIEKNTAKLFFYEAKNMTLSERIAEAKRSLSECYSAMYPLGKKNCDGRATLMLLRELLAKYYTSLEQNQQNSFNQENLWIKISESLKDTPNSVLCREIMIDLDALMDAMKILVEKNINMPNEEKDPLYEHNIGLKIFLINRLKLLIYLKHYEDKEKDIREHYIEKYNAFQEMLENQICYFTSHYISEYLKSLVVDANLQGKVALLKTETERYQNSSIDDDMALNLIKISKDVRMWHEDFLSEVKKVEVNIFQLKRVIPKLEHTVQNIRSQSNGVKRQIASESINMNASQRNHTLNCTSSNGSESTIEESFEEVRGNKELKVVVPPEEDCDFSLPLTQKDCENVAKRIQNQETSLQHITQEIESLGHQVREKLNDTEKHFNFLMDNPMRKYVPSAKKFNGHTYQEYETEFMLHYRETEK
ncbi:uncharacterized protein LOC132260090 [Phlebotomus argentipes]|uniref:uncharacterized protein LOC132260090 n=1 Tax=Phlebotomus argentipes TaxID=94469 RepID=UPI0028934097|nr:uncharacterized protein LOC132260090 [Phlebotomus argentipes]